MKEEKKKHKAVETLKKSFPSRSIRYIKKNYFSRACKEKKSEILFSEDVWTRFSYQAFFCCCFIFVFLM